MFFGVVTTGRSLLEYLTDWSFDGRPGYFSFKEAGMI